MNNTAAPWLLLSHGEKLSEHSFCSIDENHHHQLEATTSIPNLCNKFILASAYGWLVLYDYDVDNNCFLWNPVSMEKIQLPHLEDVHFYDLCILSKPPTEPDSHIFMVSSDSTTEAFCRIGDDEFITQSPDELFLTALLVFRGKIYGFANESQIVTIDFVLGDDGDEELELTPVLTIPAHQPMSLHWLKHTMDYWIESPCDREFLLIQKLHHGNCHFRIFQVGTPCTELKELESIGNRTIFLPSGCNNGAVCRYSSNNIKPNSIYYTTDNSMNLYLYDLDDRSTTLLSRYSCDDAKPGAFEWFWVDRQIFKNFV